MDVGDTGVPVPMEDGGSTVKREQHDQAALLQWQREPVAHSAKMMCAAPCKKLSRHTSLAQAAGVRLLSAAAQIPETG